MATKKDVRILQVGQENWSAQMEIPAEIEWDYLPSDEILSFMEARQYQQASFLAEQEAIKELVREKVSPLPVPQHQPLVTYQALLLSDQNYSEDLLLLSSLVEPYQVFYHQGYECQQSWTKEFLRRTMAHLVDMDSPLELLARLRKALFRGQYGAKMPIEDVQLAPSFDGRVVTEGNRYMVLDGEYGEEYQQIAHFRYNVPLYETSAQDIFWDHQCSDGLVETKIVVRLIQEGSLDTVIKEWVFEGNGNLAECHVNIDANGYLSISMLARGKGRLKIGPCHYRFSRCGFGSFVLGGERFVDSKQDEFMYYFHPQDFKPPLCVYFSGWRAAEGFEGYAMMKAMKSPFLLICDPRLSGGAFYLGSPEFEQKMIDVIQEKLAFLGFDRSQLILSGLSMGTFGAAYYGALLSPYALVIGKPVFSLGEVALKEKRVRPGGFKTSLDLLRLYSDYFDEKGAEALNSRFWQRFAQSQSNIQKMAVVYMKDEDYDATAFEKILDVMKEKQTTVLMKGLSGRHNDRFGDQIKWFVTQYRNILKQDFGREYSEM